MGMIDRFIGMGSAVTAVGNAATGLSEVFHVNQTRQKELDEEAYARSITQYGEEFRAPAGWFDSFMNGLNRLPRPFLTLGTMGLFVYAMVEPIGFSSRMEGLALVPEPLWWLLGAVVSFYFGAREAHYLRARSLQSAAVRSVATGKEIAANMLAERATVAAEAVEEEKPLEMRSEPVAGAVLPPNDDFVDNPALRDWAAGLRD